MADEQNVVDLNRQNDKARERALVPVQRGVIREQNIGQMLEHAHLMSHSKEAVPAHMRGNAGMCQAIIEMVAEWGFRSYGVANLCYVVNNRMGFEAQLWLAVINQHGNLKQRLRPAYEGEGDTLVCIIRGHFNDEAEPCEYRSPPLGRIHPKNSPLWKTDPEQQLFYYSVRAFGRRFCAHIFLGIYGRDELEDMPHIGAEHAKDVTPNTLMEKLKASAPQDSTEEIETAQAEVADAKPKRLRKPREDKLRQDLKDSIAHEEAKKAQAEPAQNGEPKYEPKDCEQYTAYCKQWMSDWVGTVEELEARFKAEKDLRTKCGVMGDDLTAIRVLKDNAIANLGGKL